MLICVLQFEENASYVAPSDDILKQIVTQMGYPRSFKEFFLLYINIYSLSGKVDYRTTITYEHWEIAYEFFKDKHVNK